MTNNFLIEKSTFTRHRFDERIEGYGHEDTLFGLELHSYRIPIKHLDNPVLNGDIETNKKYLNKTQQAIRNLYLLYQNGEKRELLIENIRLLYAFHQIKGIIPVAYPLFALIKYLLEFYFVSGGYQAHLFDVYKLMYLSILHHTCSNEKTGFSYP